MPNDIAIATQIPVELDEALTRLAAARGESKATLIFEALAEFVLSEEAFEAAVKEGLADADAGNLIPHDEVMREIDALLAKN